MMSFFSSLLVVLFVFSSFTSQASTFRNSYVSFELPPTWACDLADTEWVCKTKTEGNNNSRREAIIILTAKEVGPNDSLATYEKHLKTSKTLPSITGTPIQSKVIKVEERMIGNHKWMDGLHLSSEVQDYYTRYLATVKDRIAILVTLSAHKLYYAKYSTDFFRLVDSLRVLNTNALVRGGEGMGSGIGGEGGGGALGGADSAGTLGVPINLGPPPEFADAGSNADGEGGARSKGLSPTAKTLLLIATGFIILAAILIAREVQIRKKLKHKARSKKP